MNRRWDSTPKAPNNPSVLLDAIISQPPGTLHLNKELLKFVK